jgi:hypothetical protein
MIFNSNLFKNKVFQKCKIIFNNSIVSNHKVLECNNKWTLNSTCTICSSNNNSYKWILRLLTNLKQICKWWCLILTWWLPIQIWWCLIRLWYQILYLLEFNLSKVKILTIIIFLLRCHKVMNNLKKYKLPLRKKKELYWKFKIMKEGFMQVYFNKQILTVQIGNYEIWISLYLVFILWNSVSYKEAG